MQIQKNPLSEAMFSITSQATAPCNFGWFNVPLAFWHSWEYVAVGRAGPFRVMEGDLDMHVYSIMGLGAQNPGVVETGKDLWT